MLVKIDDIGQFIASALIHMMSAQAGYDRYRSDSIKSLKKKTSTEDICVWDRETNNVFLSSPPLGGPKWLLLLLVYEKDDIGRGNGRTKHASGGMGDSGQLMDSSTIAEDRGGGTQDPWARALERACVHVFSDYAHACPRYERFHCECMFCALRADKAPFSWCDTTQNKPICCWGHVVRA